MDSCLTQPIPVTLPLWKSYSKKISIEGYSDIKTVTSNIAKFLGYIPTSEGQLQADNLFASVLEFEGSGPCIVETIGKKKKKAYCKVTHLLDPIRKMQGYYDKKEGKGVKRVCEKVQTSSNQAYVDCLANYLLGQLRERNLSPHFCLFYGGFSAIAKNYRFDITDDFEDYRKYKDFWAKRRLGYFKLHVERDCDDDSLTDTSSYEETEEESESDLTFYNRTPSSTLYSKHFSYSSRSSGSVSDSASLFSSSTPSSHISLNDLSNQQEILQNDVELTSFDDLQTASITTDPEEDDKTEGDESEETEEDVSIYAEFENFPVMLIFQEKMEGVIDELLDEEEVTIKDKNWEDKWTCWTFQIIAALSAAQGVLGLTHNDLHANNIVWCSTDLPFLWYKNRSGILWKIPTHGKIFRLIDFGRSIFRVGENWFVSDDYKKGGDAEDQYNFGEIKEKNMPEVYPNPSFDLCRYSVSVLEGLFHEMPKENLENPSILSKEGKWVIHETESQLWNLLWSWLIDDEGKNVLRDENGTERFPDFDLYQHISAHVFTSKPQDQFTKDIFQKYRILAKDVGDWETIYPLFC